MDPKLEEAAAKGNAEPFKDIAKDEIKSLVTPSKNTILHINIMSPKRAWFSTNFVEEILEICPSLSLEVNAEGDTPLHVAAKRGHFDIVRVLIKRAGAQHHDDLESGLPAAEQIIRMLNNQKNTALHEAVCNGEFDDRLDIVKKLIEEDPDFSYSANNCGETPLYMAATRHSPKIVAEILENCPSAAHEGPSGKTALHGAVIDSSEDTVKQILKKKKSLTRERDQHGWTPLHYAAYFGREGITKLLLEFDKSAANIADKDRKMTALHLAAAQGRKDVMDLILSYSPECYDLVDVRGWNFLHFAMVSLNDRDLRFLLMRPLVSDLINAKDDKGNTPLHVLALFSRHRTTSICDRKQGDYDAVNVQKMSVKRIMRHGFPELQQAIRDLAKPVNREQYPNGVVQITKEKFNFQRDSISEVEINEMKKAAESQLVVAALIATVTFAAAFTLPGGYIGENGPNQGTAILSRKAAFQAFVITDAIAMVLSLAAVFVHFVIPLLYSAEYHILFLFSILLTMVSMVTMMIAFITGTYAVLSPSLGLAIPTCFIGLSFFPLIFYLVYMGYKVYMHK